MFLVEIWLDIAYTYIALIFWAYNMHVFSRAINFNLWVLSLKIRTYVETSLHKHTHTHTHTQIQGLTMSDLNTHIRVLQRKLAKVKEQIESHQDGRLDISILTRYVCEAYILKKWLVKYNALHLVMGPRGSTTPMYSPTEKQKMPG